jgi:RNA polymerase sigma-70 factor, ECF subfamily
MVQLRLDRRLHGRIDPSDVIQEAFVDATRRLAGREKRDMAGKRGT